MSWQNDHHQPIAKVLYTPEQLAATVAHLAAKIDDDYRKLAAEDIVVIGLLRGVFIFLADLLRQLHTPLSVEFLQASSYEGSVSSGRVQLQGLERLHLAGRHLLLVDDIVDTGITLNHVCAALRQCGPASLRTCTLLDKPSRRRTVFQADYVGYTIDDCFVVGYGMDYQEHYRQLPYLGVLQPQQP